MGNLQACFKRNKVAPEEMTIDKILSAGQSSPGSSKPYGRDEQEMLRQLKDEGIVLKGTNKGGVSFDVVIEKDKLLQRPPRRLAVIDSKKSQEKLVYTSEEKSIFAEILRQEKLLQKKENARKRRRVEDGHDTKSRSQQQVSDKMAYTSKDRVMMADIIGQDLLVEKKDKTKKMRKVKFVEEASRYTKEEDRLMDDILRDERIVEEEREE